MYSLDSITPTIRCGWVSSGLPFLDYQRAIGNKKLYNHYLSKDKKFGRGSKVTQDSLQASRHHHNHHQPALHSHSSYTTGENHTSCYKRSPSLNTSRYYKYPVVSRKDPVFPSTKALKVHVTLVHELLDRQVDRLPPYPCSDH